MARLWAPNEIEIRVPMRLTVRARGRKEAEELADIAVSEVRDALSTMVECAIDSDSWTSEDGKDVSMVDHFGHFHTSIHTNGDDEIVEREIWVTAYDCNRAYGGPEEGGWWYATGELIETVQCRDEQDVENVTAILKWKHGPRFEGNHPIGSVLCEGVLRVVVEDEPGADYPLTRPHYE